jgi:hypothetical protein
VSPSGLTSVLPSVGVSPSFATAKYTSTCSKHSHATPYDTPHDRHRDGRKLFRSSLQGTCQTAGCMSHCTRAAEHTGPAGPTHWVPAEQQAVSPVCCPPGPWRPARAAACRSVGTPGLWVGGWGGGWGGGGRTQGEGDGQHSMSTVEQLRHTVAAGPH